MLMFALFAAVHRRSRTKLLKYFMQEMTKCSVVCFASPCSPCTTLCTRILPLCRCFSLRANNRHSTLQTVYKLVLVTIKLVVNSHSLEVKNMPIRSSTGIAGCWPGTCIYQNDNGLADATFKIGHQLNSSQARVTNLGTEVDVSHISCRYLGWGQKKVTHMVTKCESIRAHNVCRLGWVPLYRSCPFFSSSHVH